MSNNTEEDEDTLGLKRAEILSERRPVGQNRYSQIDLEESYCEDLEEEVRDSISQLNPETEDLKAKNEVRRSKSYDK